MFGYGAEEDISSEAIANNTDSRGVISKNLAAQIRQIRAGEIWERVDSVVIGPGAAARSRGWFNSWADMAGADQLQWFSGRDTAAGPAYVNQSTERTDWAQDLYQTHIEFISPTGLAEYESVGDDAQITPILFSQMLPQMLSIRITLADADEIAKAPSSHFPAGFGPTYPVFAGAASTAVMPGTQGEPTVSNSWKWPEPIMLAAKAKITVYGNIDAPIRDVFRTLPGPGNKLIPDGLGGQIVMPNWYTIRITHRGPRYLQLRGSRSSS